MKKSKKLMILGLSAATAAVAATSAVSSFAWFAINDEVTVTGMTIKADAGQYLEIRRVDAADSVTTKWGKTAAASSGVRSLKPVSLGTLNGQTFTAGETWSNHAWVSTSSDSVDDHSKGTSALYSNVTEKADLVSYKAASGSDTTTYADNVYALVEEFDIRVRYLGETTPTYKLTATVDWSTSVPSDASNKTNDTSTTKTNYYLHNAARVYFVVGALEADAATTTHATAIDSSSTGHLLKSNKNTSSSTESDVTVGTSGDWTNTATELVSALAAKKNTTTSTGGDGLGNGVRVRVYFYFDGADENCFSSANLGSEYSIGLKFNVSANNSGN